LALSTKEAEQVLVVVAQPELAVAVGAAVGAGGWGADDVEVAADRGEDFLIAHPAVDLSSGALEEFLVSLGELAGLGLGLGLSLSGGGHSSEVSFG
ncbi:MAG: hypothetical protein ACK56F_17440, partial [bacterium]